MMSESIRHHFEKLEFEMDYPKYAAGGFIHYCEYLIYAKIQKP